MPTVLYLAHDFPPTGGSAANRASAFCRYLPGLGWTPLVVTPGTEWAVNRDDSSLADLDPELRVLRTRSWEARPGWNGGAPSASLSFSGGLRPPRRASALRRHLGHAYRFPDAQRGWIPFAVQAAQRALRETPVHALYTTAGPFSSHLAGLVLKKRTGLPWIAELRDGWYAWNRAIFPDYPWWRGILERLIEGLVVRHCDRLVLVTESMADAYRFQYRSLCAEHFAVVSNGFDPAQIPPASSVPGRPSETSGFEILHAGALYQGRSAVPFLVAAAQVAREDAAFRSAFRLTLLGTMDAGARAALTAEAAGLGLSGCIQDLGYQDHASTLRRMQGARLLLLLGNSTAGAEAAVPGKLFEYLAVRRPILAMTLPGAEGTRIVAETHSGYTARLDDPDSIARALRLAYAHREQPFLPYEEGVQRYDRARLSARLALLLNDIAGARPRPCA